MESHALFLNSNAVSSKQKQKQKKNSLAPFYGRGTTVSRLKPIRGGRLLFTTKSPDIPGTHFIVFVKIKE